MPRTIRPITRARRSLDTELDRIFGPLDSWDLETLKHVENLQKISRYSSVNSVAWILAQCQPRDKNL